MSENKINTSFSINPLDINLAKMQFNILKKYENEISAVYNYSSIIEEYTSKDPTLDISLIQIIFKSLDENLKSIELVFYNKKQTEKYNAVLCEGTNEFILNYLKKQDFVFDIKKALFSK